MSLDKKFSISHYDSWQQESLFFEAINNSSQQFKDEIYDIYFGKIFRYKYEGKESYDQHTKTHEIAYGNVMGVEASDEQIEFLFRIQREFGIEISLTINQLNVPPEIFFSTDDRVIGAFLDWLTSFYDQGLRSCTLANNHLMKDGILQRLFPEMKWKNTVNQQVSTAQQVLDYLHLGYNVVQLDRSLNRNMEELKKIKLVVDKFKSEYPGKYIKTSLLVMEDCMPFCPFKRAHDDLQIYHKKINYWDSHLGTLSCTKWKSIFGECAIPRLGANCYWATLDTFEAYAGLVDIFKYSGRLRTETPPLNSGDIQFGWFTGKHRSQSFGEIIENRLEPIHSWYVGAGFFPENAEEIGVVKGDLGNSIWMTANGRALEQRLRNCMNACYGCHLCEKTFGLNSFDSLVGL
jgi:hypothetical protein